MTETLGCGKCSPRNYLGRCSPTEDISSRNSSSVFSIRIQWVTFWHLSDSLLLKLRIGNNPPILIVPHSMVTYSHSHTSLPMRKCSPPKSGLYLCATISIRYLTPLRADSSACVSSESCSGLLLITLYYLLLGLSVCLICIGVTDSNSHDCTKTHARFEQMAVYPYVQLPSGLVMSLNEAGYHLKVRKSSG